MAPKAREAWMSTWRFAGSILIAIVNLAALTLAGVSPARAMEVDLDLAVDISYSMDTDELAIQREGYVAALTSPDVLRAIKQGIHGKIAVTYVEWAGAETQNIVVGWHLIDEEESAAVFASAIAKAPIERAFRTSISSGLAFATRQFAANGYEGMRRVIDISGDGPNNQGAIVTRVRDEAVAAGIVINGLPLVFKRPSASFMDVEDLAGYYASCVIGGPGAFVVPVKDKSQFAEAIRTKLVLEISDLRLRPEIPKPQIVAVQTSPERVTCTIGERLWQQRYGE
jgi:hypothetical protein